MFIAALMFVKCDRSILHSRVCSEWKQYWVRERVEKKTYSVRVRWASRSRCAPCSAVCSLWSRRTREVRAESCCCWCSRRVLHASRPKSNSTSAPRCPACTRTWAIPPRRPLPQTPRPLWCSCCHCCSCRLKWVWRLVRASNCSLSAPTTPILSSLFKGKSHWKAPRVFEKWSLFVYRSNKTNKSVYLVSAPKTLRQQEGGATEKKERRYLRRRRIQVHFPPSNARLQGPITKLVCAEWLG